MGLNILTLGSSKTYTNLVALGISSAVVDDTAKTITFTLASDGSQHTIHFDQPSDGVSVTGISDKGNGKFTLLFSDGSESDEIQTLRGEKGLKGDPGEAGTNGKSAYELAKDNGFVGTETEYLESLKGLKGDAGVSPTITENADNTDKIYKLDVTTADGTFTTPNLKGADGQGGTGGSGEENKIEVIKVNGVEQPISADKSVDITVPEAYDDTDIRAELANKADIDHTHTTVNGHTVESDVPVDAKFTDTVYDDTQVKTAIQAVANGLMDSVGYSADYKTIDIIAKNGVKKSVNVAPIISHASITELSDVDTTNKATGKALVYNATTSKHEYADVSGTDEKVKMDSSTDAKYLGELLDNVTIANENGELKVKKLDGQEVTITEINYLKGLTMNVMDLVNMFSNGGVKIINTPVATYAELLTLDKSSFIEGISYLVYVLADENHDNAKTTYLVDKESETPTYFGFADSQRDFTTNPIDLANEITGKLGISNMDSDAIKALFTVDDTYKTETATNNAFSTHGAKALYDELILAIGGKANDSDLTAHKDDTDIHVSTEDRTKWDSAKTHADSAHAPSNAQENILETVKVNNREITPDENKAVNIDLSNYAEHDEIVGENLIPYPYADGMSKTMNGIEYTVNPDGSVTAVGTAIETSAFVLAKSLSIDPNTTYILSGDLDDEIAYKSTSILFNAETSSGASYWNYGKDKPVIFTGISVMANFRIRISKDETVNQTFYPMLELGTIAHKYQPYKLSRESLRTDITDATELASRVDNQFSTASGNSITVNDSVDGNIVELGIKGNSYQKSYSGKNLLVYPYTDTTKVDSGVTFTDNGDGSITINGTNTTDNWLYFWLFSSSASDESKRENLYGKQLIISGLKNVVGSIKLESYYKTTDGKEYWVKPTVDDNDYFTITYPSKSEVALMNLAIVIYPNGVINNVTVKPMIRLATETDSSYEPYVGGIPSPNPSYPQEIKSVGDDGSLVVTSCGKNVLKNINGDSFSQMGITYTKNSDGSISCTGTQTEHSYYKLNDDLKVDFKGKYILSGNTTSNSNEWGYCLFLQLMLENGTYRYIFNNTPNEVVCDFSQYPTLRRVRSFIRIGKDAPALTNKTVTFYPMLRPYGTDGTYEPYKESTSTIPLSEPLRAIGDIKDEITYQDGKWGVLRRLRKVLIDGDTNKVALFNDTTLNLQRCTLVLDDIDKTYTNKADSAISNKFICNTYSKCKNGSLYVNTTGVCCIFDNNTFANVDEANNWFVSNNTVAIYRLATPVFEPFTDRTLPYLSTYDRVTNISNDDALSAEMTVKYPTTDASGVGSRNESRIAELAKDTDDKFDDVNESLSSIGKCKNLLNPTLQTTTKNGVTCTNNGDGTYNIVGTNNTSSNATFIFDAVINGTGQRKLLGVPKDSSGIMLQTNYDGSWGQSLYWDTGNGVVLPNIEKLQSLAILVYAGATVNHTIKPMITTDLNATYDDFVPYTGDGKTLTHDVAKLNESLANIDRTIGVEKIFNTYISSTDGSLKSSVDYITSGKINVTPNMYYNIVGGINGTGNDNYIRVASYKADGSFISRVDTIEDFVPSLECAYIRYFITNAYYDSVHIYSNDANNQINKNSNDIMNIKNDLSTKIYELAGSELYLCVSGKSCVLTLNGYNLTGSTNFSKLAEYPPYLVARNVVSKEDGVCIFSVDPDGNIGASDLQVASSVTGKMFGEVSWVANI